MELATREEEQLQALASGDGPQTVAAAASSAGELAPGADDEVAPPALTAEADAAAALNAFLAQGGDPNQVNVDVLVALATEWEIEPETFWALLVSGVKNALRSGGVN